MKRAILKKPIHTSEGFAREVDHNVYDAKRSEEKVPGAPLLQAHMNTGWIWGSQGHDVFSSF